MRTRTVQLKINLTKDEAATFDLARGKVRRAVAARLLILGQPAPRPADPAVAQLCFELNKIGVNLNQIARVINEKYPSDRTLEEAREFIHKLKTRLA
jgi:hypothetical protein